MVAWLLYSTDTSIVKLSCVKHTSGYDTLCVHFRICCQCVVWVSLCRFMTCKLTCPSPLIIILHNLFLWVGCGASTIFV